MDRHFQNFSPAPYPAVGVIYGQNAPTGSEEPMSWAPSVPIQTFHPPISYEAQKRIVHDRIIATHHGLTFPEPAPAPVEWVPPFEQPPASPLLPHFGSPSQSHSWDETELPLWNSSPYPSSSPLPPPSPHPASPWEHQYQRAAGPAPSSVPQSTFSLAPPSAAPRYDTLSRAYTAPELGLDASSKHDWTAGMSSIESPPTATGTRAPPAAAPASSASSGSSSTPAFLYWPDSSRAEQTLSPTSSDCLLESLSPRQQRKATEAAATGKQIPARASSRKKRKKTEADAQGMDVEDTDEEVSKKKRKNAGASRKFRVIKRKKVDALEQELESRKAKLQFVVNKCLAMGVGLARAEDANFDVDAVFRPYPRDKKGHIDLCGGGVVKPEPKMEQRPRRRYNKRKNAVAAIDADASAAA